MSTGGRLPPGSRRGDEVLCPPSSPPVVDSQPVDGPPEDQWPLAPEAVNTFCSRFRGAMCACAVAKGPIGSVR